jgi:hypothetical protein
VRALLAAAVASVLVAPTITPHGIGGAPLGKSRQFYRTHFATSVVVEQLEGGLMRFTFPRLRLQVYFKRDGVGAIGILTWNRTFHTAKGIGPCSSLADLRRAYGSQLKPFRFARTIAAYRLGDLWFTTKAGQTVGVVELAGKGLTVFPALNALRCGDAGA